MKTARWIIFAVALCASVFAGVLTDDANVFGPRAADVRNALASLPVWIETRVSPPAEGMKSYADSKAAEVTSRGFYVVITTQPREWRVSMNPVGLASAEGVRLAGERMVAHFKRGEFAAGAAGIAQELNRLANPPPPRAIAQSSPGVAASFAAIQAEQRRRDEAVRMWCWIVGGVAAVLFGVWFIWWLVKRAERKEEERRQRWAPPRSSTTPVSPATPPVNQAEAQRVFDSYTPEQRRVIIEERHHHHYSSGAGTDPLLFWMLLNASQPHYIPAAPVYYEPRHHTPPPAPSYDEPERRRESSSSSDSSWSSPSFDSGGGGSSFDSSGSSSDSSGGGGSW